MKVLFVITGHETGAWLSEITHPYWALAERGIQVDFASPQGGKIVWTPLSDPFAEGSQEPDDLVSKGFLSDAELAQKLQTTLVLSEVDLTQYDAVHVAGGQGATYDLYPSDEVARVLEHFWGRDKVVGAICHGAIALGNVPGRLRGRRVTGYSLEGDRALEGFLVAAWVRRELASDTPLVDMRLMAVRGVWTTNVAAFLLGVGMYASIAVIPALVELPRSTGFGFGCSITAAGLFMLPTAFPQLIIGPFTGHIERRIGSRAQLLAGVSLMLAGYAALAVAHGTAAELIGDTVALGLGLGLGLGALANLIVAAVSQEQTGVATAMNTVMRTLGGAFGAQVAASVIALSRGVAGLPGYRRPRRMMMRFAICTATTSAIEAVAIQIPASAATTPSAIATRITRTADLVLEAGVMTGEP